MNSFSIAFLILAFGFVIFNLLIVAILLEQSSIKTSRKSREKADLADSPSV